MKPTRTTQKVAIKNNQNYLRNSRNVPKSMGWLWNSPIEGIGSIDWHPGKIEKSVLRIMNYFAERKKLSSIESEKKRDENLPTLRLLRKNGEYYIELKPWRINSQKRNEAKPIVFKLNKSDHERRILKAKEVLKQKGFNTFCYCEKDFECCECIKTEEKLEIQNELEKVSKLVQLTPLELSQGLNKMKNEDEIDLTFSPALVINQKPFKIERVTHVSTQSELKSSFHSTQNTKDTQLKVQTESKQIKTAKKKCLSRKM